MNKDQTFFGDALAWLALAGLLLSPIIFVAYILIQFTLGLLHGGRQAIREHNGETEETDDGKTDNR